MRLSREKTVQLSHVVTDVLVASDDVEFVEDRATIRQNIVDILLSLLKDEEHHIDFLETQLDLLDKIGLQNYGQLQAEPANAAQSQHD
jgi:bacterioferritin (cytochrome b1)